MVFGKCWSVGLNKLGLRTVNLHTFRHVFAHYWLADGGSESDLMKITGWSSNEMVQRYASSTAQELGFKASRRFGFGIRI
ncbi:MAG: tyrosine-type recombinase/integrase [Chloroflexi bacterium]|nr:tyrosine-type recombinase/integrase [Chloroflexota bacterium]